MLKELLTKKFNPLKFISMQSQIINKWYYKPEDKWFNNRKEAKIYLGGDNKFNKALKNMDIIYVHLPEK